MLKEYLSNIANALRQTLGLNDKINAQDFANKVGEVYEKGQQAEYDKFWDALQVNGTRVNYQCAFWRWSSDVFYPKYDIVNGATNAESMFRYLDYERYLQGENVYFDLAQRLEDCGVVLDISQATHASYMFSYAYNITRVPALDCSSATTAQNIFQQCRRLVTVDKFILPSTDNSFNFSNAFIYCYALKNITFEGLICTNIDFSYSPLTSQSILSIIEHLKDYSNNGGTHTITFKADRETMLTDEQKALATNKGWSLVWN